ncbi:MAG: hypothetical protein QM532_04285 [Cyanobium sp. MAG06]|nr:hypothetical protein [Cyanobium sp. MAG06]
MKGIIIYNHSHKESLYVRYSIKEFSLAAKKAGIKLSAISNKDVILFEEKNKITIKNKLFNNKIDFIIY